MVIPMGIMEWKLKLCEVESSLYCEMYKGQYLYINYTDNPRVQFKGTEKHLKDMGFVKIGEVYRMNIIMVIEMINIPCYKGKIMLPNGEIVEIFLCLDEEDTEAVFGFPYKTFEKITIDVRKQEVVLSAEIAHIKSIIENSNKLYMEELGIKA